MHCEAFESRVQFLLDRRRRPEFDPHVRAHAEVCGECRGLLNTQEWLFDHLGWDCLPDLPTDFAERVVQTAAPRQRWLNRLNAGVLPAVVAAALLLALLPLAALWSDPAGGTPESAQLTKIQPKLIPPRSVAESDGRSSSATNRLVGTDSVAGQGPVAAATKSTAANGTRHDPEELAADHLARWSERYPEAKEFWQEVSHKRLPQVENLAGEWAGELKVLAAPFSAALSALRRTLPVDRESPSHPHRSSMQDGDGRKNEALRLKQPRFWSSRPLRLTPGGPEARLV